MQQLTPRLIRALSVEADTAEATVRRRLAGKPTRPSTCARIEAAAARLGVALPAVVAAGWGGQQPPRAAVAPR